MIISINIKGNKMNINLTNNSMKSEAKRWKKSIEKDGMTRCIEVEEVENGYIVSVHKYGYEKDEKSSNSYIDEHKKWVSKENPLKEEDKDEEEEKIEFEMEEALEYFKKL